jgi:mRNA-degrading endonuclease RelE of RelBE toxin-antitoxin system
VGDVIWEPEAASALVALAGLQNRQAERIVHAVYRFAASRTGDVRKLEGQGNRWRLRVGDWRVILVNEAPNIRIMEVVNRSDAYR